MKKKGIIIVAGGAGTRMGTQIPKQFLDIGGKPILTYSVCAFRKAFPDADIVVALPSEHIELWAEICLKNNIPVHKICEGGETRFESVKRALAELDEECRFIAVHDGVRPLATQELIWRVFDTAKKHGTAIPALEVTDSIRCLTESSSYNVNRSALRAVQTPQAFRADILRTGYERAAGDNFTDDASVVESIGYNIMLCEGERRNIKITTPVDITIAEAIMDND